MSKNKAKYLRVITTIDFTGRVRHHAKAQGVSMSKLMQKAIGKYIQELDDIELFYTQQAKDDMEMMENDNEYGAGDLEEDD